MGLKTLAEKEAWKINKNQNQYDATASSNETKNAKDGTYLPDIEGTTTPVVSLEDKSSAASIKKITTIPTIDDNTRVKMDSMLGSLKKKKQNQKKKAAAILGITVKTVVDEINNKWDIHSPWRRGRAQQRDPHHLLTAPPNVT